MEIISFGESGAILAADCPGEKFLFLILYRERALSRRGAGLTDRNADESHELPVALGTFEYSGKEVVGITEDEPFCFAA